MLPGKFEAKAKIYIDANALLKPLLEGLAVEADATSQVHAVRRALLGRPQLEEVIDRTKLRTRVANETERQKLVTKLSEEIRIKESDEDFFTISYRDREAETAYAVVRTILDSFVSQSKGANRDDAVSAQQFIVHQLREYEQRLTTAEQRLADFKKKHIGLMPNANSGYFERLQAEMQARDQLERDLKVALNRRAALRRQLAGGIEPTPGEPALATGIDARILEARARLEELLLRFTDRHPDVVALRETIAQLERQREAQRASAAGDQVQTIAPGDRIVIQNLQIALNQTEIEIVALRTRLAGRDAIIEELRKAVNTMPEVEAELARLNRDYGVTKAQYEALVQRLERARISDEADRSGGELRFRVVEPPVLPLTTSTPNRFLIAAAVLFTAVSAALGLAYLLAHARPVVVDANSLRRIVGAQVIGTVDLIRSPAEQRRLRREFVFAGTGAAGLIAAFFALATLMEPGARLVQSYLALGAQP